MFYCVKLLNSQNIEYCQDFVYSIRISLKKCSVIKFLVAKQINTTLMNGSHPTILKINQAFLSHHALLRIRQNQNGSSTLSENSKI